MREHDENFRQLERERMISLADLFEEILRRIWLIIVLAVVFAVLCAGYKYMSDRQKAEASPSTNTYARAAESLSDEEMSAVNSVLRLYSDVEATDQYMNESIRMNIDPYHEDRVTMQFTVQTDEEYLADALQALEGYVAGGSIANDLAELYPDVESQYLSELLSASSGTLMTDSDATEIYLSSVFTVQVIETDEEAALLLADAVQQSLTSYANRLRSSFGTCRLDLIDQSVAQVYDSDLKTEQTTALTNQISQQNRITTQLDTLSDDQVTVLNALLTQEDTDMTEADDTAAAQTATVTVHISKRYILLGVIIGIVLGIILIVLFYIARGALNVEQEMPGEFGIPVCGHLHVKKQRNPLVRGWRRLVYKKKPLPPETERQIAVVNLKKFCADRDQSRILLTGSRLDMTENEALLAIRTALGAEGIEAEIAGGLLDLPQTLERLGEYSCVVLVETLHKSHYKDVVRETEICAQQDVYPAGAIVLD